MTLDDCILSVPVLIVALLAWAMVLVLRRQNRFFRHMATARRYHLDAAEAYRAGDTSEGDAFVRMARSELDQADKLM